MADTLSVNMSINSMLANTQKRLFEQRSVSKERIDSAYQSKQDILDVQLKGFTKREDVIREANGAVGVALTNVERIRDGLMKMSAALNNIESGGDYTSNKSSFDLALKSLELASKRGSLERNLTDKVGLGDFTARSFSYVDASGRPQEITGTYVGSDFTLTDSVHNTTWVSNLQSGKLIEYSDIESKTTTGREAYTSEIQRDSRVGDQLSFTYDPDGEAYAVSGTMNWGGLAVGDSWTYNDLSTPEDIAEARDAIMKGLQKLNSAQAVFSAQQSIIDAELKRVRADEQDIMSTQGQLEFEQAQEIAELDEKTRKHYEAIQSGLTMSAGATQSLMAMMNMQVEGTSPFASAATADPYGTKLFSAINVVA